MIILKEYVSKEYYNNYIKSYLTYIDLEYRIKRGEEFNNIQQEKIFKDTDEYYYKDETVMYKVLLDFSLTI